MTYGRRWKGRLPWAVGQLGTMFPSGTTPRQEVRDFFAEVLATPGAQLPVVAVAAQRLAAWTPSRARALIREAAKRETHPLTRRTLALAALHAGETANIVRKMLRQHEENAVILAMLEDNGFDKRAVPVSSDFAG